MHGQLFTPSRYAIQYKQCLLAEQLDRSNFSNNEHIIAPDKCVSHRKMVMHFLHIAYVPAVAGLRSFAIPCATKQILNVSVQIPRKIGKLFSCAPSIA
jgi:hypothetical protein